jgi:hypothetical protein
MKKIVVNVFGYEIFNVSNKNANIWNKPEILKPNLKIINNMCKIS